MSKNKQTAGWVLAAAMAGVLSAPAAVSAHEIPRPHRGDHPAYWVERGHHDHHDRHDRHDRHGHKHMHQASRHGWKHQRHAPDHHDDRHQGPRHRHERGFEDSGLRVFLGYWGRL